LNTNFVLFRASAGDKIGDEIATRLKVIATPTTMILDHAGKEVDWHVGYGPPPEKFLEKLELSAKGIDTVKALLARYAQDPKNVEVVFKLARKYDSRYNQPEKTTDLYQQVLALDPDGELGTTDYGDDKVSFTEYAEFSLGSLQTRGKERSPELLNAFIQKYPESKLLKTAYGRLGSFYRFNGSKEEATLFFEDYTSRYPDDLSVLNSYIARIIRDKDNLKKGIELGEKVNNEILKYNPDLYYMKDLAQLYILNGDKEKAEEVFGKRFVDGRLSWLTFGLMQYASFWADQKTNTESAEEVMELVMKVNPDDWYNFQTAAQNYMKLDKVEQALKIYGPEFIQKHPGDSSILNSYARFWGNLGKNLESALKAAKTSVELADAYYKWDTLAMVYQKMENFQEALIAAEKAYEMANDQVKVRYQARIQQIKKAIEKEKEKK
jgi:tetratricopeptide (TPR) repeat protein